MEEQERRRWREEDEERKERERRKERGRKAEKERREKWEEAWRRYLDGWEELGRWKKGHCRRDGAAGDGREGVTESRVGIPWPTRSGEAIDVSTEAVGAFFRAGSAAISTLEGQSVLESSASEEQLLALLKAERVRWHPDKMAQHYGALGILGAAELKTVTAVFQIVDRMWGELRKG